MSQHNMENKMAINKRVAADAVFAIAYPNGDLTTTMTRPEILAALVEAGLSHGLEATSYLQNYKMRALEALKSVDKTKK